MQMRFALVFTFVGILGLGGCTNMDGTPIASSGRSGCNNINMAAADTRNDPANGLPPTPNH